jgi:glycine oxidase
MKVPFLILGNSALGLGTAFQLSKLVPAKNIVVLGPSGRVGGATVAAGAMINVWAELTHGQFENPALCAKAELTIQGMSLWEDLLRQLSPHTEDSLKIVWGTYVINNAFGSSGEIRSTDYILQKMGERGIPHRLLKTDAVPWLAPSNHAAISRIVEIPDGRIDPRKVLRAYEKTLKALGAELMDGQAVEIKATGGGWGRKGGYLVKSEAGASIEAENVVFANGSFAQKLVDQLPDLRKQTPRLLWGAGSALDVSMPEWVKESGGINPQIFNIDKVVRTVDRGGACGVHIVPYGNGEFYLGASSGVWFDPEPAPRAHAVHALLRGLVEEINEGFFFSNIRLRGPGFRPVSSDTFPLLGQSEIPGIWFANGTKRDGFTASPFITRELASAIVGEKHRLPELFRPSRKPLSWKTREEAIEDAILSDYGGEIQHGLNIPPYVKSDYLKLKKEKVLKVYQKRNIKDFGIHPEITHIYDNDRYFQETFGFSK